MKKIKHLSNLGLVFSFTVHKVRDLKGEQCIIKNISTQNPEV